MPPLRRSCSNQPFRKLVDIFTPSAQKIPLPDGDLVFFPQLFSLPEADDFLAALIAEIPWRQERITLYGKEHALPRLTAWHGDPGKNYTYSGLRLRVAPWTPTLLAIREKITAASGAAFNSVLLNYYRHGADSVAWHSDDEPELGKTPIIGSVSFGAARVFQMKHKYQPHLRHSLHLLHGSLLIMQGETQTYWLHQLPKRRDLLHPRINLTFRNGQPG